MVFAVLFLFSGCGICTRIRSKKPIIINDRVKLEVKTEYITRLDTGYFRLPKIIMHNRTRDTSSKLENEFVITTAGISDGILTHTLETKDIDVPVIVPVTEKNTETKETHDTDVPIEIITEVEVEKPFSKFVKFQLWGFWILLSSNILLLIFKIKKKWKL